MRLDTHCSEDDYPAKNRLSHEAEHDVGLLTKRVVLPRTNLLVLQEHVDCEGVEEDKGR